MRSPAISLLLALALALTPALAAGGDERPGSSLSNPAAVCGAPKSAKKKKPKEADTKAPVITHVRVTKAPRGKALTIRARFEDDNEIFAPSIYVRERGAEEFDTLPMKRAENGYEVLISAERMSKDLEYFIEAFDEEGNGPAREGSPENPLTITVFDPGAVTKPIEETKPPPVEEKPELKEPPRLEPKTEPPPQDLTGQQAVTPREDDDDESVASTWWFWTIIGVVVTGGVAGTVVLLQRDGGPVDEVDIRVVGPDPTGGL